MTNTNHPMHVSWTFRSYEPPVRGTLWYVIAGIVVGLLLVYSFATANYVFALLILMTIIIIFLNVSRPASDATITLDMKGVTFDQRYYPFNEFERFWILEPDDQQATVYLEPKNSIGHLISAPVPNEYTNDVRKLLLLHLEEDIERVNEPFSDWFARTLKL